jgi:hypothetical protein
MTGWKTAAGFKWGWDFWNFAFYCSGNYKNPFCLKRHRFAHITAEKHFCLDRILKICVYLRPIFFIFLFGIWCLDIGAWFFSVSSVLLTCKIVKFCKEKMSYFLKLQVKS